MIRTAIKNPEIFHTLIWDGTNIEEVREFLNEPDILVKDNNRILVQSFHEPFWILTNDIITKNMVTGKLESCDPIKFNNNFKYTIDSEKKDPETP